MKWVLIFLVFTQDFGSVSVTAEFDDEAACMEAARDMRMVHRGIDEPHNAYIHYECYPKGSPK